MKSSSLSIRIFPLFLCVVFNVGPETVKSEKRNMFMNSITNCKGFENAPLDWSQINVERNPVTREFSFNLTLIVSTEISTNFSMEFNLLKCETEGSLDSCEYFLKEQRNDKICSYLIKKHQFWSAFVLQFQPPLVCPIKPGKYEAINVPFQSDFIRFLPIQQPVIRAHLLGFDNGKTISCVDVEILFSTEKRGK